MMIVTGMHRSGTSLVANILHELGMDLGDLSDMYATDEWNAAGYYEHLPVMVLNDRIVLGDRLYSHRVRTARPGERPWWSRLMMSAAKSRYLVTRSTTGIHKRTLERESEIRALAAGLEGMVVKDPRFCLTLSGWRKLVTVDRILYCFRNPGEVARSIRRRERIPIFLGARLWALHIEQFLRSAEGIPVVFVNYNGFFDAARRESELSRCFAFAGQEYDDQRAQGLLSRVVRGDLKHHALSDPPSRKCRLLYDELLADHELYASPEPYSRSFSRRPA